MAIVINGSGTLSGLAVGGLPDGTVDAGTLATNSVDSAELIVQELYKNQLTRIGSHHWNFPDLPLVRQQLEVLAISEGIATISSPLTIDVKPAFEAQLVRWNHLKEIGIQDFSIRFPKSPRQLQHFA